MKAGIDYIGVSVGAIIVNDKGEIFFNKRSQNSRNNKGLWEAPGGAVHFGETRKQAVIREVKEEFGVDVEIVKVLHVVDELIPAENQHWVGTSYVVKIKNGQEPRIQEPEKCDEIGWYSVSNPPMPLSEVTKMDLKEYEKQRYEDASTS